jgi:hypothetical protein
MLLANQQPCTNQKSRFSSAFFGSLLYRYILCVFAFRNVTYKNKNFMRPDNGTNSLGGLYFCFIHEKRSFLKRNCLKTNFTFNNFLPNYLVLHLKLDGPKNLPKICPKTLYHTCNVVYFIVNWLMSKKFEAHLLLKNVYNNERPQYIDHIATL